ncbi:MAG: MotA/TolQ/ExbB proton channel family protein [Phycisphaerae bacterium]|nr:MotA/TolQ/ExbB proton channel family protein [Phycisphaerae bacterium]
MKKSTCLAVSALTLFLLAGQAWAEESPTLLQLYVIDGGWIVWFILVPLSLITIGLAVGYILTIRSSVLLPEMEQSQLTALLSTGQGKQALKFLAEKGSFLAAVMSAGLKHASGGSGAAIRAAEEVAEQRTVGLFRKVEVLSIIGNIAPMIGLFGTVYGMIMSFQQMAAATLTQRPVEVAAGGIRTALVTTFWGLLVGIPALCVYALFRSKIEALASNIMVKTEQLLEGYEQAAAGKAAAAKEQE